MIEQYHLTLFFQLLFSNYFNNSGYKPDLYTNKDLSIIYLNKFIKDNCFVDLINFNQATERVSLLMSIRYSNMYYPLICANKHNSLK